VKPSNPDSTTLQRRNHPIPPLPRILFLLFGGIDVELDLKKEISWIMGFFDFMERAAVAPRQFSTNVTQNSFNDFDFPPPVSISSFGCP
jgi:hypothetical protein